MDQPSSDPSHASHAPGAPGADPTWTSSAKDMVGASIGASRVWFTLGFGIVNEVYYPRVDTPQVRDLGFIVSDGKGFWIEVKRLEAYTLKLVAPGVPAVEVVHTHQRFTLTLRITPDPDRDVLAIESKLEGDADLSVYVLLAPHLGATGYDNLAQVYAVGGRTVLGARQGPFGLALAVVDGEQADGIGGASAGYVGSSDGWQDFNRHGAFTWRYQAAGPGNVSLTAAIPRQGVLTLGFGASIHAAGVLAISSAMQPFDGLVKRNVEQWTRWHADRDPDRALASDASAALAGQFELSAMVLRSHRDKTYPGTMVASLSVPWGNSHDDRGGYHLVWPRDLVECATALLAIGAEADTRNTLRYLIATQKDDGGWSQNQWLSGEPYWTGAQLDETAFPILLAAALAERDALGGINVRDMVMRALNNIIRNGPSTEQDRWEENAGLNAFTLAIVLAALVAGAEFVTEPARSFVLQLADAWNARLEDWLVVKGSALAKKLGVPGYYVRIAPAAAVQDASALNGDIQVKNRGAGGVMPISELVGTDFLQLVRFGIRAADDPWILASVTVADALLKADTPSGPAWRRYTLDGYGEHEDGGPFDGSGVGRAWPLLTGERGHYELAAGHDPTPFLEAMNAMTGPGGMIPEQVWDAADLPERRLFQGKPSGSAMPLVWAHAEFIKLMLSRAKGRPIDRPQSVWRRWGGRRPKGAAVWTPTAPITTIAADADLVIATFQAAKLHWGRDGWRNVADTQTADIGLGVHAVRLPASALAGAARIDFTFQELGDGRWDGRDYHLDVRSSSY